MAWGNPGMAVPHRCLSSLTSPSGVSLGGWRGHRAGKALWRTAALPPHHLYKLAVQPVQGVKATIWSGGVNRGVPVMAWGI